jgi:tetratricopeptide (TPR) repeat protein
MPKKKSPKSPRAAVKRPAVKRPAVRMGVAERDVPVPERTFPLEIDPKKVEESLAKVKGELVAWANKGRYTKVRFKFRGKQLLPDLPLAAVVAAEGLTFYWTGILRLLIGNIAGKMVFDVELVNDSEKRIARGKEELLSGEVDKALECFREALAMERDNPRAHLNLGVALKLKGDLAGARAALEKAKSLEPEGPVGVEAERLLAGLPPAPSPGAALATKLP